MAKSSAILDWCIVRLGEDHNWWVEEVSDSVRWDTDGLSLVDPRQLAHLLDLVEPLRDYGFDQDIMELAFLPFRIQKDLGSGRVRLKRVKDSIFESEEKLFALPDILDEENGPYADLLDHLTRCRVKMLNDLFNFESKLTVDEVEDEIREEQNASFIEGRAVHCFEELTAILDFTPAGWEGEEEGELAAASVEDLDGEDLPDVDEADEEALKNDSSLKWDEDEESDEDDDEKKSDDDEEEDEDEEKEPAADDEDEAPRRSSSRKRR